MAKLTTQRPSAAGTTPSYAAADVAGDRLDVDASLHVKNGSAASINVTVASPGLCNHGGTHPLVVAVPAGGERLIGPFTPGQRYANPTTGLVDVTYSAVASVTVAALDA